MPRRQIDIEFSHDGFRFKLGNYTYPFADTNEEAVEGFKKLLISMGMQLWV